MEIIKISALWCPSCILMNQIFSKLKEEFKDIDFKELDLDFDEEASEYEIGNKIPVFVIKKDNREIKRIIGEHTYEELREEIKSSL